MPKKKVTNNTKGYEADQQISKSSLKNLVLNTDQVVQADSTERVSKLETHWTAKSLFQSTIKFKAWRKKYSKSGAITAKNPVPYRGTASVLFTQVHKGVTQAPDNHSVSIMFSGLKFAKEYFKGCIEVQYKGHYYYIEKPSLSKTTIRVRCSCKDFYFCGAYPDYINRCILGPKPKPYVRKTPPPSQGGRNYRNPRKISMLCKHIFNALRYLKSKGLVKP